MASREGDTEEERVGVVEELMDSVGVAEMVWDRETLGEAEPEGLREGLLDCEALLVSVGELDIERVRTGEKDRVGLEVMDFEPLSEAVKEGEAVELVETRAEEDSVAERKDVELCVGEAV